MLLCAAVACGRGQPPEPYENTFGNERAAAQAVTDALQARDTARLQSLVVTAAEFRKNIWPHLPASGPEVGMPVDYIWNDTAVRNHAGLAETMREYAGRKLVVEGVQFAGPTTDYGPFRLHRKATLTFRAGDGTPQTARLFGSMIETRDGWKVFSYIVD